MLNWSFHVEMVFSHDQMVSTHVQLVFSYVEMVFLHAQMIFSHVQLYLYLFVQRLPGSADGAEYSQVQLRGLFPVPMFCQCFATSLLLQERCLNMTTPSHAECFSFLASFILYTSPGAQGLR